MKMGVRCAETATMRRIVLDVCVFLALLISSTGQERKPSDVFRNDMLKRGEQPDRAVIGDNQWREVSGMWVLESNNPEAALLFPEQVTIICTQPEKSCRELKVTMGVMAGLVDIEGPDETIWQINSWDQNGLLASYDVDSSAFAASEKCHRHVLSMSFASGAVSTSDIPTHEKGCDVFKTTNSYRLVRGNYFVDTTLGKDGGKPPTPGTVRPK